MSSSNYNPYNYPYQQSSAQQYTSGYQTAPVTTNIAQQPSRQYQATTQAPDYMSYQAQPYRSQSNAYGGAHDNASWSGGNYGSNRETTSRAAEALRNMSNPAYTPNTTGASQLGFTGADAAAVSRYSSNTPQGPQGHQPPQSHATASYGQSQPRPRSVNTNRAQSTQNRGVTSPAMAAGYPSQRATTVNYNQQPQRTASPAQPQYAQSTASASSTNTAAMSAATATQYDNDYHRRQLPNPDASRTAVPSASASYSYADTESTAPPAHTTANSVSETYGQSTTTVDPLAVYDPWPEYQRKQEALRAQKAVEEAEEHRKAEAVRKEEEHKKEEEEKRKRMEDEEKARQVQTIQEVPKSGKSQQTATVVASSSTAAPAASEGHGGDPMEGEIRALMAKMREFNSKDPALLARIWEEERRAKVPKSPTVQSKPAPRPAPPAPALAIAPSATLRKKPSPRSTPAVAKVTPTPTVVQPVSKPVAASAQTGGNTIWPPDKKAHLASAAAAFLSTRNPSNLLDAPEILRMLDGNPSYIELCEQLEQMGLKLDRAAFAKRLLNAVPDVNSASRAKASQGPEGTHKMAPPAVMKTVAPPAVMKNTSTPGTLAAGLVAVSSPAVNRGQYPPFPDAATAPMPVSVAEMVPIRTESKAPANKEEAARKRTFNDLIDLTQMPEDEADFDPPPKRLNLASTSSYGSPAPGYSGMEGEAEPPTNFPLPARPAHPPVQDFTLPPSELRHKIIVEPLDRKKALRRNTYNIATIARDVLLACGRHPDTRQLNQHLEVLKTTLPQITNESDLSTLRWDLIDPGRPPPGYFANGIQKFTEDADDEDDSDVEDRSAPTFPSQGNGSESTGQNKAQASSEAINPFKKRRGQPWRHSFHGKLPAPTTPKQKASINMSGSAPRPTASAAGVGYSAFRSATEYDADGKPLPKKRGRPVGWRKNIHGSSAAQSRSAANGHTGPFKFVPSQASALRNVTGEHEPIRIDSRSPSVPNNTQRFQSFACKWKGCKAELHNLDTLKKHVSKVHRKESDGGMLECFWAGCGTEVTSHDPMSNMRIERHEPKSFSSEGAWRGHLDLEHFQPLSWNLGDGPASGLSDATDFEAYLSDAHGRCVTPRITVRSEYLENHGFDTMAGSARILSSTAAHGRGRPPKNIQEQKLHDAYEAQAKMVSQKRRLGGPGMDRGGATLVTEKRRKGFSISADDETAEELVDAEA